MCHRFFLTTFLWFLNSVFLLLVRLHFSDERNSRLKYWCRDRWIRAFPKSNTVKWNATALSWRRLYIYIYMCVCVCVCVCVRERESKCMCHKTSRIVFLRFFSLYPTIRRDSIYLQWFPFCSHVHFFSWEILLACRFKYPYSCFSSHFCFLVIFVLLMLMLPVLFLVVVIILLQRFFM